ncbi:TPA: glycosyltransferase family 2 protein [Staphylococcus aureus]
MRLTIIIPTCNNEATIRQLLISIESKEHYRILCIDGGSTDQTIPMIERLQRELKHISLIQLQNASIATCINKGLMDIKMTDPHDSDAFMVINPTSIVLPGKLDRLTAPFKNNDNIDMVIGQRAYNYHGEWKLKSADEFIKDNRIVTLTEQPDLLSMMSFDGKLFSAKFAELQCDETLANTYNHAILVKAMQKATDIHLVSQMIVGDNDIDTHATSNDEDFNRYIIEIMKIRQRVMEMLLLPEQRLLYSDMVDRILFNNSLKYYMNEHPAVTHTTIQLVKDYIMSMQHSDYVSQNMFDIINTVEFIGENWDREIYELWRQTLIQVGINRPTYKKFLIQLKGRKFAHRTKSMLKR